MSGKQAIGAALIGLGLLLLIATLTNRVGAVFATLIYGAGVLKEAPKK
jgi:hypothetical protein